MPSLRDRLLLAEEDFITSLTDGTDNAIRAFEKRWGSVVHDVNAAADTDDLDDETSALAHVVATRMCHIAEAATDLFSSYNTLTVQLVDQLDGLMSELSLEDVVNNPVDPRSPQPTSRPPHQPNDRDSSSSCHGKRRRTYEEADSGCQLSYSSQRPKRRRLWSAPPASSLCPTVPRPSDEGTLVPAPPATSYAGSTSRKRRLSEADATASCCKRFHTGSRLHAVSDSFHIIQQEPPPPTVSDNLLKTSSAILSNSIPLDIQPLVTSCEGFATTSVFDNDPLIEPSRSQGIEPSSLLDHGCFDQFLTSLLLPHRGGTTLRFAPLHDDQWSSSDGLSTPPMAPSQSSNNSPLSARSLSLPPTTPVAISLDAPLPCHEAECVDSEASEGGYGFDLGSIVSTSTKSCFDPPQIWSDAPPPFMETHYTIDWCSLPNSLDPLSWLSIPSSPHQLPTDSYST